MDATRTLFLSPHLDDVAFSCGGWAFDLVSRGVLVSILTMTAGNPRAPFSPFAQSLHSEWQLGDTVAAIRRQEDVRACEILGGDRVHWSYLDCIYRLDLSGGDPLYPNADAIFGSVADGDSPLLDDLAGRLDREWGGVGKVVAPLGVGNHVDHQILRRAAERAFGGRVEYYEDYPYAEDPVAVEAALARLHPSKPLELQTIPLTTAALEARIAAMACYASQLGLFYGPDNMANQVRAYVERVGGERIWKAAT